MTPAQYNKLATKVEFLRSGLELAEAKLSVARSELIRLVECNKLERSVQFVHNGRIINAKKNAHWGFDVTEGKKSLCKDLRAGVHDIRVMIALGEI
jgi:hypothetical protein